MREPPEELRKQPWSRDIVKSLRDKCARAVDPDEASESTQEYEVEQEASVLPVELRPDMRHDGIADSGSLLRRSFDDD